MRHDHQHRHHHSSDNLKLAFFLNLTFTIFEIIGGFYVNSVAIISDAIHDLGDSLSLGMAWYLNKKSKQSANEYFSFGYARFSLLGALLNSVILVVGSIFVLYEAGQRLMHPEPTDAQGMVIFAIFGVLVNGYAAWKLSGGDSLNEQVVSWHLLEDVLGWVAVLIAAIVLLFWDIPFLDPALSILITAYILWNVFQRLRETSYLFLQGTPDTDTYWKLQDQVLSLEGIDSLHHTHIWSLDGEKHVFSTHVKLAKALKAPDLLPMKRKVKALLQPYRFSHCTIEMELFEEHCEMES